MIDALEQRTTAVKASSASKAALRLVLASTGNTTRYRVREQLMGMISRMTPLAKPRA